MLHPILKCVCALYDTFYRLHSVDPLTSQILCIGNDAVARIKASVWLLEMEHCSFWGYLKEI